MRLETKYTIGNVQRFVLPITGSILRSKLSALLLLPTLLCFHCWAESNSFSLDGHYKSFFTVIDTKDIGMDWDQPVIGAVSNRLRFKLSYNLNDWLSLSSSYCLTPKVQDPSLFSNSSVFAALSPVEYRVFDLDSLMYPSSDDAVGSFGLFQNLDRLLITLNASIADIYIGRQAISWGSARVINPTDIISPFTFDELDTEERRGVDALRIRIPTGTMGEIDLGAVFGKDLEFGKSVLFLKGRFNALDTDLSLLLLEFQKNLLGGIDVARSIGGAGFWFESAYVFADVFNEDAAGQRDDYTKATIGLDYSFNDKSYGFLEYHWNQAGTGTPDEYLNRLNTIAYTEGATYLMGKHYIIPGVTYQITPLITLDGQILLNLMDPSAFLSPKVEHNIAQDIYISIGALIGFGGLSSSEFGGYPDIYYSSFRIYF